MLTKMVKIKSYLIMTVMVLCLTTESLASRIQVIHSNFINIRSQPNGSSDIIGKAYFDHHYEVIDEKVTYYLVKLTSDKQGWARIPLSILDSVDRRGNTLKARSKHRIPVYSKEKPRKKIGELNPQKRYPYTETFASRRLIKTPDGVIGWIFAGSPYTPWVSHYRSPLAGQHNPLFELNLTEAIDQDRIKILAKGVYFSANYHRLSAERDGSRLGVVFHHSPTIHPGKRQFLQLVHRSSPQSSGPGFAPITVVINDQMRCRELVPSSEQFSVDQLDISQWLKPGSNVIELRLTDAQSDYNIQSIKVLSGEAVGVVN